MRKAQPKPKPPAKPPRTAPKAKPRATRKPPAPKPPAVVDGNPPPPPPAAPPGAVRKTAEGPVVRVRFTQRDAPFEAGSVEELPTATAAKLVADKVAVYAEQ